MHLGARERILNWVGDRAHIMSVSSSSLLFFPFLFILKNAVFSLCIYLYFKTASSSINKHWIVFCFQTLYIHFEPDVFTEHYLYERITENFRLEYSRRTCMTFQFALFRKKTFLPP